MIRSIAAKILISLRNIALFLGAINTRILLTLLFFFVITPMAALFRLFGSPVTRTGAGESLWTRRSVDSDPEKPF